MASVWSQTAEEQPALDVEDKIEAVGFEAVEVEHRNALL